MIQIMLRLQSTWTIYHGWLAQRSLDNQQIHGLDSLQLTYPT